MIPKLSKNHPLEEPWLLDLTLVGGWQCFRKKKVWNVCPWKLWHSHPQGKEKSSGRNLLEGPKCFLGCIGLWLARKRARWRRFKHWPVLFRSLRRIIDLRVPCNWSTGCPWELQPPGCFRGAKTLWWTYHRAKFLPIQHRTVEFVAFSAVYPGTASNRRVRLSWSHRQSCH